MRKFQGILFVKLLKISRNTSQILLRIIFIVIFTVALSAVLIFRVIYFSQKRITPITELKDEKDCEKIVGLILKDRCYSRIAGAKKDQSICEKIKDPKIKEECYRQISP